MRKLSLLLLALLVVSGAAFAQLVVEPTVEAEGYATFGVDLDEGVSGIQSGVSSEISFVFVEEQTQEFGEGDVYGYIEVEDFKVEFSSDDAGTLDVAAGDVTAKVMFGPAYLELASDYDTVDEASDFSLLQGDIIAPAAILSSSQTTEYAGVTVGADLEGLMSVGFSVASQYDWVGTEEGDRDPDADKRNLNNAYMLGLEVELTAIDMVTVTLISHTSFGVATGKTGEGDTAGSTNGDNIAATPGSVNNPAAVGLGFEYEMPMGDMTLTPNFGVDVVFETADSPDGKPAEEAPMDVDLQVGLGANLTWAGLGIDEDDADYFGLEDQETTSGVGFGATYLMKGAALQSQGAPVNKDGEYDYYSENWISAKVGLFEDEGDDGLLPVIGAALIFNYDIYLGNDVTSDTGTAKVDYEIPGYSRYGLGVEASADLGVISPYFGVITGTKRATRQEIERDGTVVDDNKKVDPGLTVNLGTDINVISNTTFTIDWASGNLGNTGAFAYDDNDYTITAGLNDGIDDTSRLGVVTVKTKVEF